MRDTLFCNGIILTMNHEQPTAEAVALRGNRVLAVGSETELRSLVSKNVEVIDLNKRSLLPGFHDSHVHLVMHGFELNQLHLDKTKTLEEALELIAQRTADLPAGSTAFHRIIQFFFARKTTTARG
jgi:predicted amidohydrolase YtcJ